VCQDSTTFRYKGISDKDCGWADTAEKCGRIQIDGQPGAGEPVSFFCPSVCVEDCFTGSPTISPTDRDECEDSITFEFDGDEDKNCAWATIGGRGDRREKCESLQSDTQPGAGLPVSFFCPSACDEACGRGECEDSTTFLFKGQSGKGCSDSWATIAKCKKKQVKNQPFGGEKISFFCPAECDENCITSSPSASPSAAPSASPTDLTFSCDDSTTFLFDGNDEKDCEWARSQTGRKCDKTQEVGQPGAGRKVDFFCPRICKNDLCACVDSTTFKFEGNPNKDCSWAADKKTRKRCKKPQSEDQPFGGKLVKFFCPAVCKRSCRT